MANENRPETCDDCGFEREREWAIKVIHAKSPVPKGWQIDKQDTPSWKTISAPTKWVTLCDCDAELIL